MEAVVVAQEAAARAAFELQAQSSDRFADRSEVMGRAPFAGEQSELLLDGPASLDELGERGVAPERDAPQQLRRNVVVQHGDAAAHAALW